MEIFLKRDGDDGNMCSGLNVVNNRRVEADAPSCESLARQIDAYF